VCVYICNSFIFHCDLFIIKVTTQYCIKFVFLAFFLNCPIYDGPLILDHWHDIQLKHQSFFDSREDSVLEWVLQKSKHPNSSTLLPLKCVNLLDCLRIIMCYISAMKCFLEKIARLRNICTSAKGTCESVGTDLCPFYPQPHVTVQYECGSGSTGSEGCLHASLVYGGTPSASTTTCKLLKDLVLTLIKTLPRLQIGRLGLGLLNNAFQVCRLCSPERDGKIESWFVEGRSSYVTWRRQEDWLIDCVYLTALSQLNPLYSIELQNGFLWQIWKDKKQSSGSHFLRRTEETHEESR
jgi:hypothetical protein